MESSGKEERGIDRRETREIKTAGEFGGSSGNPPGFHGDCIGDLRDRKRKAVLARGDEGGGSSDGGDERETAIGGIGSEALGIGGAMGGEAKAGGYIGEKSPGVVLAALAVAEVTEGVDEGGGALAVAGEDLGDEVVGVEDDAARVAHPCERARIDDDAALAAARAHRHR